MVHRGKVTTLGDRRADRHGGLKGNDNCTNGSLRVVLSIPASPMNFNEVSALTG